MESKSELYSPSVEYTSFIQKPLNANATNLRKLSSKQLCSLLKSNFCSDRFRQQIEREQQRRLNKHTHDGTNPFYGRVTRIGK